MGSETTFGDVYAHGSARITQVGTINAHSVHLGSHSSQPPSGSLPDEFFSNVPLQRTANFVVRPALRHALKSQLYDALNIETSRSRVAVVYGMPGSGKTQLALDYIQEFRKHYNGVFWVNAESRSSVEQKYRSLYRHFFQVGSNDQQPVQMEEILLRLKNLFYKANRSYLWVFDNADNVDDPNDAEHVDLLRLIPDAPSVQALVTSRSAKLDSITPLPPIEIGNLDMRQALDLFWNTCKLKEAEASLENLHAAELIVEELECLALAVNLAGSTIRDTPSMWSNLSQYLDEHRANRRSLLEQKPDWLISQYGSNVLTAWETAFEAVASRSALAATLLGLVSLLDGSDIYLDLFDTVLNPGRRVSKAFVEQYSFEDFEMNIFTSWQSVLVSESPLNVRHVETAFTELRAASLIQYSTVSSSYSMHALVQAWAFERLDEESKIHMCCAVLNLLCEVAIYYRDTANGRWRIAKHIIRAFRSVPSQFSAVSTQDSLGLHLRLNIFTAFLSNSGLSEECKAISKFDYEQLLENAGEKYHLTLRAQSNLASILHREGKLEEAVSMERNVVEKLSQMHGFDDVNTLRAMGNLGISLNCLGNIEEACDILEQVVKKGEEMWGKDGHETLIARRELARIVSSGGQDEKAEGLLVDTLARMKRILGEDHLQTLQTSYALAYTLYLQEKYDEAVPAWYELLDKHGRVNGDEHPNTILVSRYLAATLAGQGNIKEAIRRITEVVDLSKRVLGIDHSDTIKSIELLGWMESKQKSSGTTLETASSLGLSTSAQPAPVPSVSRRMLTKPSTIKLSTSTPPDLSQRTGTGSRYSLRRISRQKYSE